MAVMSQGAAKGAAWEHFPAFRRQREHAKFLDTWHDGKATDSIYMPDKKSVEIQREYEDLMAAAGTPLLSLIVGGMAQTVNLIGIRNPDGQMLQSWDLWQRNQCDRRQASLNRSVLKHGLALGVARPGLDRFSGERTAKFSFRSMADAAAFYDPDDDEWPLLYLQADTYRDKKGETGWTVQMCDESAWYYLSCKGDGSDLKSWTFIDYEEHGFPVPPVVQYGNIVDLDGRHIGEIEPLIPVAKRIDQTTFDRLIVQRYGAWKVRYVTGMAKPKSKEEAADTAFRLSVEDLLIGESKDTKFGTLDPTDLKGFIEARGSDLRDLSSLAQFPTHQIIGLGDQMQPESLAAAEAAQTRRRNALKVNLGERHEQLLRAGAFYTGNMAEAGAYDSEARWAESESRSLVQTAQAMSYFAAQVGVPQEMLFEMMPNWSDSDVKRALSLVESGRIDSVFAELERQIGSGDTGLVLEDSAARAA